MVRHTYAIILHGDEHVHAGNLGPPIAESAATGVQINLLALNLEIGLKRKKDGNGKKPCKKCNCSVEAYYTFDVR